MAESESQEGNYYNRGKMVENFKTDMEELLEEMEKLAVCATWMAYDCVAIQANPDLSNAMQHLEDICLMCKEQMEKKWQEVLLESRESNHDAANESTSIISEEFPLTASYQEADETSTKPPV